MAEEILEQKNIEDNVSSVISEAVENLVGAIVKTVTPTVKEEITEETEPIEIKTTEVIREEPKHNSYYVEGVPFLVELKFTHWTPEIEDLLMKSFMKDEEILPGVKINKLYKATLHSDSLYLDSISEKLDAIKSQVDNYRSEIDMIMKRIVREAR